jgi:hypothetical protein
MGKLIPQKQLQQNAIESYLNQVSNDYSNLMEGSPTFVTYYSKDGLDSTQDQGLENVVKIVGTESPIKYNKVKEFAMYGIQQAEIQTAFDDFGLDTTFQGDAVVIPNTIKPLPQDYFSIFYNGDELLFRITEVQTDKAKGAKFYRIQYELSRDQVQLLDEQINKNYEMDYSNFGTGDRVIVEEEAGKTSKQIDDLSYALIDLYDHNFRDQKFDIFTFNYQGINLYNRSSVLFIKNNNLFVRKGYYNAIYVQDLYADNGSFDQFYDQTIYSALEYKDKSYLALENFYAQFIDVESMPFYQYWQPYYYCQYSIASGDQQTTYNPADYSDNNIYKNMQYADFWNDYKSVVQQVSINSPYVTPHNDSFVSNIQNNLVYGVYDSSGNVISEDPRFALENIIIKYLNGNLVLNSDFLNYVNGLNIRPNLQAFLLIPCLLFILKEYKKQIMS